MTAAPQRSRAHLADAHIYTYTLRLPPHTDVTCARAYIDIIIYLNSYIESSMPHVEALGVALLVAHVACGGSGVGPGAGLPRPRPAGACQRGHWPQGSADSLSSPAPPGLAAGRIRRWLCTGAQPAPSGPHPARGELADAIDVRTTCMDAGGIPGELTWKL